MDFQLPEIVIHYSDALLTILTTVGAAFMWWSIQKLWDFDTRLTTIETMLRALVEKDTIIHFNQRSKERQSP